MSEAYVGNISKRAIAIELVEFLESKCGRGEVLSCVIETAHGNWSSRGYGYVQFSSKETARILAQLASDGELVFCSKRLRVDIQKNVGHRPERGSSRADCANVSMGYLRREDVMECLWSESVSVEFCSDHVNLLLEADDRDYKLELQSSAFVAVDSRVVSGNRGLLLQLSRPPFIFKGSTLEQGLPILDGAFGVLRHYKALKSNSYNYSYSKWPQEPHWARTTDFTASKAISQSLFYWLDFSSSDSAYDEAVDKLSIYRTSQPQHGNVLSLIIGRPYASVHQEAVPILKLTDSSGLHPSVVFKLNYLVQNGYLSPAAINEELFSLLKGVAAKVCVSALKRLERQALKNGHRTCFDPVSYLKEHVARVSDDDVEVGEGQTYVKRLVITPSKIYCMGPELEGSNRVTRKFGHLIDNFVRVSFVDEDFGALHSAATCLPKRSTFQSGLLPEPSDIYHRVLSVLENGVVIGNQHFKFLAFSTSQLREHSCWMFAESGGITAEGIRSWMGNFDGFTNVAKCAARMGQSFSSSRQGLHVSTDELEIISDVEAKVEGVTYCFSDGIGKVSKEFGTELAKKAGCKLVPSAFQIRYGGYKGVVAVDPRSSSKMSLRPSMSKFQSEQTGVDVLSWTKYAPYYLNRQIIILMSTLGVEDEAFLRMQQQELEQVGSILENPPLAIQLIQAAGGGGESQNLMVEMLSAGYTPSVEPYLRRLMDSFRALQLHLLRVRSRIYVPRGRSLMGCLDETRTLDYGQVFVQVSPTPGSVDDGLPEPEPARGACGQQRGCVVRGKVVIAKNPCLHPGDLLVLEAIDVPQLHHMLDCIVFPQRGKRPHPNECSGSDLDGDLYFVSWESSLIPSLKVEAMSYEPSSPAVLDHPVTIREIQEFFADNMLNDSLGAISNAHLVHADMQEKGANDSKCLELAELASTAVDFAKTGVPAVIPGELRPRKYPDFMENEIKTSYESRGVLGKLYRALSAAGDQQLSSYRASMGEIVQEYDSTLVVSGYEKYVQEAALFKSSYDSKLYQLIDRYQATEAELLTGHILGMSKNSQKTLPSDARDRIAIAVGSLKKEARGWFGEGSPAKAYAWYHVTYHPAYRVPDQLMSFPWLVFDVLIRIKRDAQQRT